MVIALKAIAAKTAAEDEYNPEQSISKKRTKFVSRGPINYMTSFCPNGSKPQPNHLFTPWPVG